MKKVGLDSAQERLLDQVFAARTLAEIDAAKQALHLWLADHPDEPGMADAFEVLSHYEESARAQVEAPGKAKTSKDDLDVARSRLLDQVFAARTLAEIDAAKQALHAWLAEHPDEPGMADAFEVLSHQEDFSRAQEVGPHAPWTSTTARRSR